MELVVVTTGAVRHAELQSNRHHQQTNIQFFTGQMPFLSPKQQCQSTEGNCKIECSGALKQFCLDTVTDPCRS